jgi:hypothetical protein
MQEKEKPDFRGAGRRTEGETFISYNDISGQLSSENEAEVRQVISGRSGNIRIKCLNSGCSGSQDNTLSIDADTGAYQCFRCSVAGNVYHQDTPGNGDKKPMPEFLWEKATPCTQHPYLDAKGVKSYGLRKDQHGNLLIPLYIDGHLSTIQFISESGKKVLLSKEKGGRKKGASFQVGTSTDTSTIYMCEGYATAASVFEATGAPCFMAVDAGNLKPAAEILRRQYPKARFIFCADNDRAKKPTDPGYDVGYKKAVEAAQAVNGLVCMPEQPGYDFNDLHQQHGLDAVKEIISKAEAPPEAGPEASEEKAQPLPLTRKTDPGEPHPTDALGDILGPACHVMTEIVQAPAAICAHALLSAACLCAQPFADIEIDGRVIPISENFLSILGRSGRKSATDAIATAIIRQWERERLQEHQKAMSAYRDDFDAYEQQKRGILQNKKLSLHDKHEQLAELRQHEPERPITPILLMSDNTYEGLVKSYIFGSPTKGLFADEGGLFTGGFSMSAEKMLYSAAGYSKLWDGARVDRIRAGSEMEGLYGRRLTMHLMMQEQPAAEFFNNEMLVNQGFMSRVCVACPESLIGTRHYNTADPNQTPEMQRFNDCIAALLEKDLPLKQDKKTARVLNELEPRKIQLLPDAKALWIKVYEAIESESGPGCLFETISGFAGKAAEHCLRIAGIMAVFENPDTRAINLDQIKRASDLITYYLNERVRIKAMAAPDLALIRAQELLAWLKDKQAETVTLKEVYQKGPSKLRTADEARAAVKTLEDHFWLIPTGKKNEWRLQDAEV